MTTLHSTGQRVAAIRSAAGHTIPDMRDALVRRLPPGIVPSESKLRRFEAGRSAKVDPITLCAIAAIYGKRLSDIDPDLAADLDAVDDLLSQRLPCMTARTSPDQGVLFAAA